MRPLDKGNTPIVDGREISVADYGEWRRFLIERIGYYCAYCNIPLSHNLNVEHVIPKNPKEGVKAGDPLGWENMLLACGPCNNAKTNHETNPDLFYLPESHNTLIPFTIVEIHENVNTVIVEPAKELTQSQNSKAQATIELFDLDKSDSRNKVVDIRWRKRKAALDLARNSFELFAAIKIKNSELLPLAAENIARTAAETGFFMVWFEIFKNEPLVLEKLLSNEIIPGTSPDCFVENTFILKPRNPENKIDNI